MQLDYEIVFFYLINPVASAVLLNLEIRVIFSEKSAS